MGLGKMIGQGRTAEVYEWEDNKVVKLFKENISENAIKDEQKINRELHKKGLPVAETYDLVRINGRYGIVYERINGPTMLNVIASKPWKVDKSAKILANLHKAIQTNIEVGIQSQKSRVKENIAWTKMLDDATKSKLYDYIDTLPEDNTLCHGDLHPDNVLMAKDKIIVIDWNTATKGNPLSDVARTSIMFKYGVLPEEKTIIEKCMINLIRRRFLTKYLKRYLKISGNHLKSVEEWELPIAAARLIEGISYQEKEQLLEFIHRSINNI